MLDFIIKPIFYILQFIAKALRGCVDFLWGLLAQGLLGDTLKHVYDPTSGYFSQAWGLAKEGYNTFMIIGIGLFLVYWYYNVQDKMTDRQMEWRTWVRLVLALIIPLLIIANGFELLEKVVDIGNNFYLYINNEMHIGDSTTSTVGTNMSKYPHTADMNKVFSSSAVDEWVLITERSYDEVKAAAGGGDNTLGITVGVIVHLIGTVLLLIIPALVSVVIDVFMIGILVTRGVAIIFYTILAPVGLSDAIGPHEDFMHSSCVRFIKKYASVCLQAGAIALVIKVNALLVASVINSNSGVLLTPYIIMGIALGKAGIVGKSGQFIDTIMGV